MRVLIAPPPRQPPNTSRPQDLIRRLLTVDPKRRLTAAQAVTHPWLLSKDADLLNHNLGVNLEQLKLFNARAKLRAAIKSVSVEYGICVHARWGWSWMEYRTPN